MRTTIHAAKRDFPNDPKPRVLIVLTEGEDNSRKVRDEDTLGDDDIKVLATAPTKDVRPSGAVVRVVMIDEETDGKAFGRVRRQFKETLEAVEEPWGTVERVEGTVGLAGKLTELLRPQAYLKPAEPATSLPASVREGLPVQYENARRPV